MDSTTRPATSARRLGQVIRAARKTQGLTLAQLGERTGYSAAQVSRYERGITPPGLATLRRFATALEISRTSSASRRGRPGASRHLARRASNPARTALR
jgi:transcriptional regulator with XRE-family HTH domain